MKIYTKTGDKGFTSLIGGSRVPKYHIRIESYGTVDELNSCLGMIACQPDVDLHDREVLKQVQDRLFDMGAVLAADPQRSVMELPGIIPADITLLEAEMDAMEKELPALKHFILPGGNTTISYCHLARCVCRRAERLTVQLAQDSPVDEHILIYLNRLSDHLFMLARKIGHQQNIEEIRWMPRRDTV